MLELYIKLVKAGKRTIDSIPEKFWDDVSAANEAAEDAAELTMKCRKGWLYESVGGDRPVV